MKVSEINSLFIAHSIEAQLALTRMDSNDLQHSSVYVFLKLNGKEIPVAHFANWNDDPDLRKYNIKVLRGLLLHNYVRNIEKTPERHKMIDWINETFK